ncbi:MAG: chemotaxis protein CheC, partial [Oscillospiraceae bacterium]|nr:chemotaxis protein CheC [Oscillospiraceae bacterium]
MHSEFGAMRMDALTEVFNVIMGAASTATASMLDAKTSFTVKTSELYKNTDLKFHKMDPSVLVKIDYFKGVTGFFYLLFKQDDLQLMLNQLMGMPPKIDGSFTFDDVNLSAVTEIVNLFMGAATTSLAQMVNTPVEIATPETTVNELGSTVVYSGLGASDDTACVLNLKLEVEGIVTSEFYVILSMELARGIADKIMGTEDVPEPPPPVPVTPAVNTENDFGIEFDDIKKDAIGEVNNITMGAAATAISNLLDAKVWITTPSVSLSNTSVLSFPALEPSVQVKIEYIKGISGSSLLVLKQRDVQLILNQLMGQPLVVTDDFEFNELNISAVCEVMNQMMGASATALSKLIDTSIDISTPIAQVHDITKGKDEKIKYGDLGPNEDVCVVSFNLTIDDVVESEFISVLSIDLANEIAEKMLAHYNSSMAAAMDFVEEAQNVPASQTPPPNIRYAQPEQPQYVSQSGYVPPQYSPQQQYAQPPEEMQQRAPQQPYYA